MVLTVGFDGNISGAARASKHPIGQQEFRGFLWRFKIGWVNQPRSIEGTWAVADNGRNNRRRKTFLMRISLAPILVRAPLLGRLAWVCCPPL